MYRENKQRSEHTMATSKMREIEVISFTYRSAESGIEKLMFVCYTLSEANDFSFHVKLNIFEIQPNSLFSTNIKKRRKKKL